MGGKLPHHNDILYWAYLNGVRLYVGLALEESLPQKGIPQIDGKFFHHIGPGVTVHGPVERGALLISYRLRPVGTVTRCYTRLVPGACFAPGVPRSMRFPPLRLGVRRLHRPSRCCGGFVSSFHVRFAFGVGSSCGRGGFACVFSCPSAPYSDHSSKLTMF